MTWQDWASPFGPEDFHSASHRFRPERLILARELRGLTQAELASRTGKTPSALSQFESARLRPDALTIRALALALKVRPGFLAHPLGQASIRTEEAHFRALRSTSQRHRRRLLARGAVIVDFVSFLETRVTFPHAEIPRLAACTPDELEHAAIDVRRAWNLGLGPIPNLIRLLELKGVVISRIPGECADVDAFSVWSNERPLIFLVVRPEQASRSRFDAAHELAHLVLHPEAIPGNREHEEQAHRFAGAFLVPREPFLAECPRRLNWDHLFELKRRWGVSVAALIYRAYNLGLFSKATLHRAFSWLNRTRQRLSEKDEPPTESVSLLARAIEQLGGTPFLDEAAVQLQVFRNELDEFLAT